MLNRPLIYTLASGVIATLAFAVDLPSWITRGPTMDSSYHYVTCSHDGLDPEDVKQVAESKCLTSAAKLAGVTVTVTQKTVQSLTGADSSEIAEVHPRRKDVRCEWTDRYLEKVGQGYRVWLRCRVKKSTLVPASTKSILESPSRTSPNTSPSSSSAYKRAIMIVTMVPQADRLIVIGDAGERVIEVSSNVVRVELNEGDLKVVVKRQRYKDAAFALKQWRHGDSISHTFYLEQEL